MKPEEIRKHWDHQAAKNRNSILSTTKTPTIKQLEINAFRQVIEKYNQEEINSSLIEVGCGNGHNLFGLAGLFRRMSLVGVDYSEEMISAAKSMKDDLRVPNVSFATSNALSITDCDLGKKTYNFVLSNRMLINLNSWDLQRKALRNLRDLLDENGFLLVIENFTGSYNRQNDLREIVGLPRRTPDSYNKFLCEDEFEKYVTQELRLEILETRNFASLHDVVLYVLLPLLNNGEISYSNPIMGIVAKLLSGMDYEYASTFGEFGQNYLYVLRKY